MAPEKLEEKNGCEHIYHPDEAMMAEKIRNAIKHDEAMMKDGVHEECLYPCLWKIGSHEVCLWSCPWKIREFIENMEDSNFFLQALVEEGGRKVKKDNANQTLSKTIKAIQDLDDPNELITNETMRKVSTSSILDVKLKKGYRKTTPQK